MFRNRSLFSLPNLVLAAFVLGSAFLSGPLAAQVTGTIDAVTLISGQSGVLALRLNSPSTLDGISGEIRFDAAVLTNPSVNPGAGATGYTAAGNQISPGVYRFILYKNPPNAPINQAQPALNITFGVDGNLLGALTTSVTFELEASASVVTSSPPNVLSIGRGGPGGNPPAQAVVFNDATNNVMGRPLIVAQPIAQSVNVNQTVNFLVAATGLGEPFAYQWTGPSGNVPGGGVATVVINSVDAGDAGNYRCNVANAAGTSQSFNAALVVFDPPAVSNAQYVSDSIPDRLDPNRNYTVGVTMRNSGVVSWSQPQNHALGTVSDPNNLLVGGIRYYFQPSDTVVKNNQQHQFYLDIVTPVNPGQYQVQLQMLEEFIQTFGQIAVLNFNIQFPPNTARDWEYYR